MTEYLKLMRLHLPTGALLLLFPCLWSILLASKGNIDYILILKFILGAFLMRGAGCVINDFFDQDIDQKVERTKIRPIASGKISNKNALIFLLLLLFSSLLILLSLNKTSIYIGFISVILITIYPLMKRVTKYPQIFFGLFAFSIGALLGYSAVTNNIALEAIYLYIANVFWSIGYDTIYAHQDKKDDQLINAGSMAIALGDKTKIYVFFFYSLTLIFIGMTKFNYLTILGAFSLYLQLFLVDLDTPKDCMRAFKSNIIFGIIIVASFII